MSSKGNFGAIVFGTNFGVNSHVAALRAAGFEVLALIGRDPERTQTRARRGAPPSRFAESRKRLGLAPIARASDC